MALCNFCKRLKVRPTDLIFMTLMCIVLYFVYTYQFQELQQDATKRKEAFKALQKACMMEDNAACEQIYTTQAPPAISK